MPRKVYLLALVLCLGAWLSAHAQQITLKSIRQPLRVAMTELTKQYGLDFAYSSDQINLDQLVNVNLQKATLEQTLKALFNETDILYNLNGSQIVLYRNPNYRYTISGRVHEKGTGELLIGTVVQTNPVAAGAVTNGYGYYALSVPAGKYTLACLYVGFKPYYLNIDVGSNQTIDIEMEASSLLSEVVISEAGVHNQSVLNKVDVPLKKIGDIPMILGEKDVLKYMMLMPGLQKGNEGNSYLYVRGGSQDQNLVLMDDATIYNAYHLYGLSSLFNGSELRNAELIKGGFSSRYGGRLSSVLNMSLKDGNRERLKGEASAGLISSSMVLEGPIVKNKASFMVSGRRSYIDAMSRLVAQNKEQELGYYFYDVHAKLSADINSKNRIMLSGYYGNDDMANQSEELLPRNRDGIQWGNRVLSFRWNHYVNQKLFTNTAVSYSNYRSRIAYGQINPTNQALESSELRSAISDITFKSDIDYLLTNQQRLKAGIGWITHFVNPSTSLYRSNAGTTPTVYDSSVAHNPYTYVEYENTYANQLYVSAGLRFAYYQNEAEYYRIEPRLLIRWQPSKYLEIGSSYAMMNQFLHLISSFNGLGLPSDVWLTSNANLVPQQSQLITLGVTHNRVGIEGLSVAVEGYYKQLTNIAVLREGGSFFLLLPLLDEKAIVQDWRSLLTQGNANAYGVEFSVRKESKKWNGWVSYTWSKTMMTVDGINNGKPYAANYDRRHDLGIFLQYRINTHWKIASSWVFGSGYPLTLPTSQYVPIQHNSVYGEYIQNYYGAKNNLRMEAFHRLDLSLQYQHELGKRMKGLLAVSIYNVYNRANPFFYEITQRDVNAGDNTYVLKRTSLFPIMPSLSYSIQF
jgi:hypothetical protein